MSTLPTYPPMDFPASPVPGQLYTAPSGVVYSWNGYGWVIGFYNTASQQLSVLGDVLDQIRTFLQVVDVSSGQYRYSTDSIVQNINMGLIEMYRLRPDIFLANDFMIPAFTIDQLDHPLGIEEQYVPALVFYGVGMTQARDDEETQDQRSGAFVARFSSILMTLS